MPVIYKKLQHSSQMGYNSSGENYTTGGFNYGLMSTRVNIIRFSHVEVPKGSTINSATLHLTYSVKDLNTNYSVTQSVYTDEQVLTQWLDPTRPEWSTGGLPHRTWSFFGASQAVNLYVPTGTENRVVVGHNVKPHMDAHTSHGSWTLAGGSMTFLLSYSSISSPDYIYLQSNTDGWSPMLVIDFTPPVSDGKATVVNIQENAIFNRSLNAAGTLDVSPHGFNPWFGAFTEPNVSVVASHSDVTTPPPSGGSMLRLQATTGRFMEHFGLPRIEEGKWYNYSCYTWMPLTSPANFRTQMTLLGDSVGSGMQYDKGVWVRHNKSFMMDDTSVWGTIEVDGETWNSTAVLYVAGVQLTEGRMMRPWIGGNKTLTGADYGWAGVVGTNGFVRAVPPNVSLPTQPDRARRKFYAVNWTYSQASGHVQDSVRVKIRKVR